MDLYLRYRGDLYDWWQLEVYKPMPVFGVEIIVFKNDLRHATMLEF